MKPEPVSIGQVCSLCELPWPAHGDNPTLETCIHLLKCELARLKRQVMPPYITASSSPVIFTNADAIGRDVKARTLSPPDHF